MTTDEDKISSLYQQAKNQDGKESGPPAHLDKAILKAAHEAVEHVSPLDELLVVKGPFSGGWRATASIAAVLIITVILVPLIEQEGPVPVFDVPAFNAPALDAQVDGLQTKHIFEDEIAGLEAKKLKKEKIKKRVMQDASKVQLEEQVKLDQVQAFSESNSIEEQAVARQNISAMHSASPAPASIATPTATGSNHLQQQEVEAAHQKKQLSQPKVMPFEDTVQVEELSPEQWLEKIRQLLDKDEVAAAEKELDAFKLHYPDEKIDPQILQSIQNRP